MFRQLPEQTLAQVCVRSPRETHTTTPAWDLDFSRTLNNDLKSEEPLELFC